MGVDVYGLLSRPVVSKAVKRVKGRGNRLTVGTSSSDGSVVRDRSRRYAVTDLLSSDSPDEKILRDPTGSRRLGADVVGWRFCVSMGIGYTPMKKVVPGMVGYRIGEFVRRRRPSPVYSTKRGDVKPRVPKGRRRY